MPGELRVGTVYHKYRHEYAANYYTPKCFLFLTRASEPYGYLPLDDVHSAAIEGPVQFKKTRLLETFFNRMIIWLLCFFLCATVPLTVLDR